ncbi:hypothetical protein AM588_10008131 [Phytophthora nicotianae]|uniref:Uncharacterized protein n=1 Tax=Phytophthora nicotianae TaxID=4792 RepID=A0A0W8DM08_PHYNI|nr:hypothetical protein AM588_10008131 [Phytophthora nicotianae]
MFLQKLLDPEDEQRRRIRRARIVRRNRIKREVAKGLPVRKPRLPRALNLDSEAETEEWSEPKSPFRPTFGGNLDGSEQQQQAVNPLRIAAQQSAKPLLSSAATKSLVPRPFNTNALPILPESVPAGSHKRISQHIRAKWQEVYQQVVFNRHEEILTKDPNRKWRQERFGLLLFAKGEYARASEHLSKALTTRSQTSLRSSPTLSTLLTNGSCSKASSTNEMHRIHQELLLDKVITEGPRYITVMYLHTRLNEMLQDLSTPSPVISKPKQGHINVDVLFQELYKLAKKTSEVTPPSGIKWKAWMTRSETYTIFAEYFRSQGESILASDALSRSLELLEESESSQKPANLWRGLTKEQRQKRVALYVVLARNYYQCNQMEKAIRSMEAVFDLDPLHAEARACLVEWFPTKWQKANTRHGSIATTAKFAVNWQLYSLMSTSIASFEKIAQLCAFRWVKNCILADKFSLCDDLSLIFNFFFFVESRDVSEATELGKYSVVFEILGDNTSYASTTQHSEFNAFSIDSVGQLTLLHQWTIFSFVHNKN